MTMDQPSPVVGGAEREFDSLAGAWVLDLTRSDDMSSFLRCMCVPEFAIDAQVAGEENFESRNVLRIEGSTLVIHKHTKINFFTERFEFNVEKITPTRHGHRRATVELVNRDSRPNAVVVTTTTSTEGGSVHLVETRRLMEGGRDHTQELYLTNYTTGHQSITRRTWTRVPMTPVDEQQVQ